MYTALEIAKYIVNKCVKEEKYINNSKLQKILCLIQKEYIQNHNRPIFPDNIEAWTIGPVVPNVYYYYCSHGSMSIIFSYETSEISDKDKEIINRIVEGKRDMLPWDLAEECQGRNSAWDVTYKDGSGNKQIIPWELIYKER